MYKAIVKFLTNKGVSIGMGVVSLGLGALTFYMQGHSDGYDECYTDSMNALNKAANDVLTESAPKEN